MRLLLLDVLVAAGGAGFGASGPHSLLPQPVAVTGLFGVLRVRRRWPTVTVVVVALGTLLGANYLADVVALYTIASCRGPVPRTWLSVLLVLGVEVFHAAPDWNVEWKYVLLAVVMLMGLPLLGGFWMYQRAKLLDALRDRAEQAERERDLLADRAVAAERRRIAGEMHDVVAHRVGVIALQAGALTVISDDERTGAVAEVIRQSSTAALAELRDVLTVLRADEPEPVDGDFSGDASPPVGLDGVCELVRERRDTGLAVELDLPDPLPETSVPVGRAAYRVVQEALTNAGKHAPGAAVRVRVRSTGDDLVVEVVNTAVPAGVSGPARAAGAAALPSSGYGLVGMRERVTLAGGAVRTGPTETGGYQVRAVFPGESGGASR